jgi:ABC-type cobalamin/Fe3+-siderophores transport system ATPase subunit
VAGTLDLIREWATDLDYWERTALERIESGVALTETDYQNLLSLCMQDAGLIPMSTSPRPALTFPIRLADKADAAGYSVERLFNLQNVNSLPSSQEIRFGPQLTVVYGANSSGKTGYTRPLGCAAFARGEREVLTDARKASTNAVPRADIEITKHGVKKTVTWAQGARCPELSGVYVFDDTSINAHLTRANAPSFSPAGLPLLTKLADVTDTVRERLRKVIEAKSAEHTFNAFFPGDSSISREITNLSARTDVAVLERAAVLSTDDEARILDLDQQIAEVKSRNIPKRIGTLNQEVKDLRKLIAQLDETALALGTTPEAEAKALITELDSRRQEAERVGADQFRFEQFTQVGRNVWREFIGAAKALADAEAQRGTSYPQPGDACLFCRQTLSPQSMDLINRLWKFLTSGAPARFQTAQAACRTRAGRFQELALSYFGPDAAARRILDGEAAELVVAIDAFLQGCSSRSRELQTALNTAVMPEVTAAVAPSVEIVHAAIKRRLKEISSLETSDPQKELEKLEQTLRELRHRRALGEHLADIKVWVDGQQWASRAKQAVGSTRHITDKYNELFGAVVTDQYRDVFQTTLDKLKPNLKLVIETRGQKGETVRQIVLSPDAFAQRIAIDKILSDGEKRAVALADFLTEVTLDTSSSAIVLDDPVSSFDSDSKEAVAELLVEHAAKRQVIVLTHDLAFLYALKVRAKKVSVRVVSHWIRSEAGQPGFVYLDNSPICEGDYKSAQIARNCYSEAKNAPPAEQERKLQQGFGALRSSYEAFVIYGLFNEVVQRFEERVSFDRLKDVSLDHEVVEQVVEKLGTLSRHIDAHLHSDTFAAAKPTPEILLGEIEAFEDLRRKQKDSKKAAAAAKSTARAVAARAGGSKGE